MYFFDNRNMTIFVMKAKFCMTNSYITHRSIYAQTNIVECGALVVEPRTREREVGGSRPTSAGVCVHEQDTFTPRKVLVIPWKWWLCADMTKKIVDWDVKP